jgi:hypothetical protein
MQAESRKPTPFQPLMSLQTQRTQNYSFGGSGTRLRPANRWPCIGRGGNVSHDELLPRENNAKFVRSTRVPSCCLSPRCGSQI